MKVILSLSSANAAIDEIDRRKSELAAALAQTGTKLAEAEASLGESVLSGNDGAVRDVQELRLRVDGLSAALNAIESRRAAALIEQKRATAADLRGQAAVLRGELEVLDKKTKKHLDALSELEGVRYSRCVLSAQRGIGTWERVVNTSHTELERCHPSEVIRYSDPAAPYATPRSRLLVDQAAALEQKAEQIELELDPPADPINDNAEFEKLYIQPHEAAPKTEFARGSSGEYRQNS